MSKEKKILPFVSLLVVILISANLRAPITCVGPVLDDISTSLGLSAFQGSLLTSIPLLMFAAFSIPVSRVSAGIALRLMLLFSVLLMIFGLLLRVQGTTAALFAGSVLVGFGICVGNVLLPPYIRNNFQNKVGLLTGVFSVSMAIFAAAGAGFSRAIGEKTGYGWRGALGFWAVISVFAAAVVITDFIVNKKTADLGKPGFISQKINVYQSPTAWYISVFMGLQSLVYYCAVAYLPKISIGYGIPPEHSGYLVAVMQVISLPFTFYAPIRAGKARSLKPMILFVSIFMAAGVLLLLLFQGRFIFLAAAFIGLSTGTSFSLAILMFSLKSRSMAATIRMSGMAQSLGYLIASAGPPLFAAFRNGQSWLYSYLFLLFTIGLIAFFGFKAASGKFIDDEAVKK